MRQLWQEPIELLRSHPVLWLPYILTELLVTFFWRIRIAAARELFEWFSTRRTVSVFGVFRTENPSYRDPFHAAAVYGSVGLVFEFLCVCLFVFALVVTATLVDEILAEQEPHLMTALETTAFRWRAILWFSLKTLIVCLVFMAIGAVLLVRIELWDAGVHQAVSETRLLLSIVVLLVGASIAWLLIPSAFRLLQGTSREIVEPNARKQGVMCGVIATVFSIGLGFIASKLEAGMMLNTPAELTAACIVSQLLVNSAFAPLLVALSLLAFKRPNETVSGRTP